MKVLRCLLLSVEIALLAISSALASRNVSTTYGAIDTFIENDMTRNRIPGVALVVSQRNEVVYRKGYGIAGPSRPMAADTPMFIGSQTKSFTAAAIMQLVEAGLIQLDEPVQCYIPWFKVADKSASEQITVRSLLNHSSGLSEQGYTPHLPNSATLEDAVRDLQRAHPTAHVGEKFQYFNFGYVTLGYLVEKVSGQSYDDYLRQHIFEPLRMKHSSANPNEYPAMDIAQGYSQVFGFPIALRQPLANYYLPAGFIVSSADDLARFLMAMENGGKLDGVRILSKGPVDLMLIPNQSINSFAGFGWEIRNYYNQKQITHGGATERFYTSVVILPESGLTITMLINQDHMFKASYDYLPLFWGAVDILTGHPIPKQAISGVTLGWGLLMVFLIIVFFTSRNVLALPKQTKRLAGSLGNRRWLSLLPHFISVLITLLLMIKIGPSLVGRGFDLRWFIGFYPDVAILAGFVLTAETLQALAKIIFFLTLPLHNTRIIRRIAL